MVRADWGVCAYRIDFHQDLMNELDTNKDGKISLEEWLAEEGNTEKVFNDLDADGDGALSIDELVRLLKPALVIEGGALTVMGIGVKEEEARGLADAQKAYDKAIATGAKCDSKELKEITEKLEIAKDQTEKMNTQQKDLIMFAAKCPAVLCCRVSPQQKGDITRLVKKHLGKITLGVGDGANDVDMITAAHLGVGIHGVEGSQAVNSADFALSQFKHLQNLLFVHGRWTYRRIARAVVYFFYKNMIPTLTILFYILATGFSGTGMYNEMVISAYNLVFTSMPVIVFALMEQDATVEESIRTPNMYTLGQNSELLNPKIFGLWIGEAVWASIVCFMFSWYALISTCEDGMPRPQGQVSIAMFTCVLLVVTLRLAIDTQFWTWIHAVFYLGSIAMW